MAAIETAMHAETPPCPPGVDPARWARLVNHPNWHTSTLENLEQFPPDEVFRSDEEMEEYLLQVRRNRGHLT